MWKSSSVTGAHKSLLQVCLLILVSFISACSSLNRSDKPATKTWWLEPYTGSQSTLLAAAPVLVDVSVTVVPGLDSQRILTLSDSAEMNKYAAVRWADSLPELVTSLVSRSLEASGRFEVVSSHGRPELCHLELNLQKFYAKLDTSGITTGVQVAMSGRYKCEGAEPVIVNLSSEVSVPDNRMTVIVAAFQQAVNAVISSLIEQI